MSAATGIAPKLQEPEAGLVERIRHYGGLPLAVTNLLIVPGALRVGDFPRVGIPLSIAASGVYAVCAVTYWRWLGLFG